MAGKITRFQDEEGRWQCNVCEEWKPEEAFVTDMRHGRPRSYCRLCHRTRTRKRRQERKLFKLQEAARYVAVVRFMKKNPQVLRDFFQNHKVYIAPFYEEALKEAIEEYENRSKRTREGIRRNPRKLQRAGGGDRTPLQKEIAPAVKKVEI